MDRLKIYGLIILITATVAVNAQTERKFIRKGNRQYEKAFIDSTKADTSKFQKAEADYRKALDEQPNSWDATYNLGNSLYRQAKYDEAARQFQAAASLTNNDKVKKAAAFHNLGNSYLNTKKLEQAVDAYKNALRNNPNDFETKYNLAWAQDKLRQQQNQQQQNQDQDKQDKDQQKDKQKQDQQKQDQQKQDQQKQDQQKQQDQQQQQQDQQQQQKEGQISKEDAMRILEAMQNDEKEVQDKVQKQKAQPSRRRTQKDW